MTMTNEKIQSGEVMNLGAGLSFAFRHPRKGIKFVGRSMTEQAHKEECDIHNIMGKYEREGILSHVSKYKGTYSDMVDAPDFQEMQNTIAEAKSMFETVPSRIREQFQNDPGQFLQFMQDEKNVDAIEEMGLDARHLLSAEDPRRAKYDNAPVDVVEFGKKSLDRIERALSGTVSTSAPQKEAVSSEAPQKSSD